MKAASEAGSLRQPMAKVTFWLQYHADFGQRLRVIGSHASLGKPLNYNILARRI